MRRERTTPAYDLEEAKKLARARSSMTLNRRVRSFVQNRYGVRDVGGFVSKLICSINPDDFYKCEELEAVPGVWADIYSGVLFEGEEWYVKFFIDDDGAMRLSVLSATWDGYIH